MCKEPFMNVGFMGSRPFQLSFSEMMNEQQLIPRPWILNLVPFLVVILIAVHVLALVYWIYRLATEKQVRQPLQPERSKAH
ncbi:hypothetical protein L6164_000177 [Bauhinia variegata]|uniref:Uncharacterized protein n=1 Tax=Bauhinia variegata TaxID=167791 RepID=A0ACB9Q6B8_BAUVA|nr:hypothetical protein L6164_000177 [Bauhinia variegata]